MLPLQAGRAPRAVEGVMLQAQGTLLGQEAFSGCNTAAAYRKATAWLLIDAVLHVQHQFSSNFPSNTRHGPTALSEQPIMSAKQLVGSACGAPDAGDAQVWGGGVPAWGYCLAPRGQCGPAFGPSR